MLRFRLFGFPVAVHGWFWITAVMLGGGLHATTPAQFRALVAWVLAAFLSVLVHELGHALARRRLGDRQVGIILHAFGGLAYGHKWLSRWEDLAVSLAGPAAQIIIGLLLSRLGLLFLYQGDFLLTFWFALGDVSLFWALLNLLPIIPLDGGRISLALWGPERLQGALWLSLVVAVGSAIYAASQWGMFAAFFLGAMAWSNFQQIQGKEPNLFFPL